MLICFLFLTFLFIAPQCDAQSSYTWVLKQPGTSLGDPVDYERANPNNVYYGSVDRIYKSTNRGETFSQMGTTFTNSTRVKNLIVNQSNPNIMLVALEGGQSTPSDDRIIKTTNAGQTWTVTLNNVKFSYFGIPMTPDHSINGRVYTMNDLNFMQSTDFGDTWTVISTPGTFNAPDDMEVFPGTSIILCGDNGVGIMKSSDYGLTWTQVFSTSGEVPTIAIDPSNPGHAYASKWGGGGGFIKTSDYGSTWTYIDYFAGKYTWGVDVCPDNPNYVATGEYTGNNYFSHDRGNTWFSTDIPSNNYSIHIIDTMTIYSAQGNGFYKLTSPYFIPVELVYFNGILENGIVNLAWTTSTETNNLGFEVEKSIGGGSLSAGKQNAASNWETIGFVKGAGTSSVMNDYFFADKNLFAVNQIVKYRLKQIDMDGKYNYSKVIEIEQLPPPTFLLEQNYPNPFNPSTKIKFSIPDVETLRATSPRVSLKVFDVLGNDVETLVNEVKDPGVYEVEFSANNIPAGIYFYKLQVGNYSSVKKLILMK